MHPRISWLPSKNGFGFYTLGVEDVFKFLQGNGSVAVCTGDFR